MNYSSQIEYAENIRIIGEVLATKKERLMYIVYDKQNLKHYFCFHLLDSEKSTVEYVIPTSIEELQNIKDRNISIARFIRIAHAEDRLFKHVFRLKDLEDKPDYEIMRERRIFPHTLPPESTKFREIQLYSDL